MIKILHSSDWHLGKSLFAKSLLDDQRVTLEALSKTIASETPDLVILAGDLYDRSVPPEDAVKLLDQFLLETILESKVPVALIPGNHDSSTRVGVSANLLRESGLHVFATAESIHHPLRIESGDTKATVYGVPYLEPSEWSFHFGRHAEGQIPLRTHEDALIAILDSLKPQLQKDRSEGRRTVLILHAYVSGGEPSESERPLSIGGSDLVSSHLLADFDYVALGHLHRPQQVGSERIRYPGSLFSYSQSEADQDKGLIRATLGKTRDLDTFEFVKFEKTRKLKVVRGALEELVAAASLRRDENCITETDQPHDYVIAMLTDQSLPFEAFRRLNQIYPGLLHVGRDVDWSRSAAEKADLAARTVDRSVSDRDVLAQFILNASASEVSDEDREWLLQQLEDFTKLEDEASAL